MAPTTRASFVDVRADVGAIVAGNLLYLLELNMAGYR